MHEIMKKDKERKSFLIKRGCKTILRALHISGVVGCGGILFGVSKEQILPYWIATMLSGTILMLWEIINSKLWIIQLKGVFTILKLALLVLILPFPNYKAEIIILVTILAVFTAHGPSEFRHYSIIHKKVISNKKEIKG